MKRLAQLLAVVACCGTGRVASAEEPSAAEIVARHIEARGGAERWRGVDAIEMTGTYSAFSKRSEFRLIRKRGDLFRLDFELLDAPSVRARDAEGSWMLHGLLKPEAGYVGDHPYKAQLEREALFPPVLLDYEAKGIGVESLGPGDVDGVATLDLKLTFPDGSTETWHLDALSFLEVAVDSVVMDHTQAGEHGHEPARLLRRLPGGGGPDPAPPGRVRVRRPARVHDDRPDRRRPRSRRRELQSASPGLQTALAARGESHTATRAGLFRQLCVAETPKYSRYSGIPAP